MVFLPRPYRSTRFPKRFCSFSTKAMRLCCAAVNVFVEQITESILSFAGMGMERNASRFDSIRRLKFNDLKPNDDIYQTAEEVGIKPSRIAFTNQEKKWIHLLDTGIHIHIDDDVQVIKDLDYYKNVKGFDCNDKNLEEKLFEYIESIDNF